MISQFDSRNAIEWTVGENSKMEDIKMYHYVENNQLVHEARSFCSTIVKEVEIECRKYGINSQAFLVGSGGKNLITQNNNEKIDFDYNLNILSCKDWENCKQIKETVRLAFNRVMNTYNLGEVNDSTSCLTTKEMYFTEDSSFKFSIDLAIVTQDCDGIWNKLIHQKTGNTHYDKYFWNQAPKSDALKEKSDYLKRNNHWDEVRKTYLDKKNFYLKRNDGHHPSFICYIEAVNEVYYKYSK